jgi:hypothetical protein
LYQVVQDLHRLTDQPYDEESYRISPPLQSTNYTLKVEDEMQLADDLASLTHVQESVENVTAVTLQENAHGLVI